MGLPFCHYKVGEIAEDKEKAFLVRILLAASKREPFPSLFDVHLTLHFRVQIKKAFIDQRIWLRIALLD